MSGCEFEERDCPSCGEPFTPVHKKERWCKPCTRRYNNDRYKNRQSDRERIRRNDERIKRNREEFVVSYLLSHPCVDCGESDVVVLEFDHVRGEKTASVSDLVRRRASLERIKEEIDKCDVRCANCHRRQTAVRGGWSFRLNHASVAQWTEQ